MPNHVLNSEVTQTQNTIDNQSSLHQKKQAWSALFTQPMSQMLKTYTASVNFDKRLAKYDIVGSLAHAAMLAKQGIISEDDHQAIKTGLNEIYQTIELGQFNWQLDLEDVHLNIEGSLTQAIGIAGKRLHTGRSRNDQVATDIRLWLREEINTILNLLKALNSVLVDLAEKNIDTLMPGFTHLQVAQPISFAHHMLAYCEMFERDAQRFFDGLQRTNSLPLGAAALAGTTYNIDRSYVAELLGFERICQNSLDAVSDRDFAIEFCSSASICMMHVSRMCEEIILWMNPRFAFITLSDAFCTGSSIMPQKKNPDVAELARGKTARVYGHLMSLLTLMKSQPLAYNKDNQEDKEPLFDTVDTLNQTLSILIEMMASVQTKPENMLAALQQGHAGATDLADFLVKKGLSFRDAHEAVAHAVKLANEKKVDLSQLSWQEIKEVMPDAIQPLIDVTCETLLQLKNILAARNHLGGTAPNQIKIQIANWRTKLQS